MLPGRRISRYVLRELAMPTLLGLLLYTFVLLMNHFFLVAEKSLSKNLGFDLTARLFAVGIPRMLVLAIPMAILLGTLIAIGRLSADHEWVALQSAGRGPGVLLRPIVLHGLIGTATALGIYAFLVPDTNYAFRTLRGEILLASNLAADMKPRVFYDLPDDAVLFVDEIRPGTDRRLEGVVLIQSRPREKTTELILARYGDLYPAPDRSGALLLDLQQGVLHLYDSSHPEKYRYLKSFETINKRLNPASYLAALVAPPDRSVQDLSMAALWHELGAARLARDAATGTGGGPRPEDYRLRSATVEFHQRLALPLASLFFAVLALPLGITRVRSGKGAGFAMSLLVLLVYWGTFVPARNQAVTGSVPAALGPWVGNLVIGLWAAVALWRLHRRSGEGPGLLASLAFSPARLLRRLRPAQPPGRTDAGGETAATSTDLAALGGSGNRFVGRLDEYLALAYLRVLVLAAASAYAIYALIEVQGLMDSALRARQPLSLILGYLKYFAPGVLHIVLPVACLVGALVSFTLLSRTGELVALRAAGVSLRRATVPLLLVTGGLCVLLFLVQDRVAPAANRRAQEIKDRLTGRAPRTYGMPITGRWSFGPEGRRLYHYRLYDPTKADFQGLSVFTLDRSVPRILEHRFSERASWTGDGWKLRGGWVRTFPDGALEQFEDTRTVALDPPGNFVSQELSLTGAGDLPEQLSMAELRQQIRTLQDSGYDIAQLRVSYHGKFAQACAPLVMVLLGLPFAFKVGRRGSLYGIGVALSLVLVYWAVFAIFNALGLETVLRPYVAAWAPNVLFSVLGLYLMLHIRT